MNTFETKWTLAGFGISKSDRKPGDTVRETKEPQTWGKRWLPSLYRRPYKTQSQPTDPQKHANRRDQTGDACCRESCKKVVDSENLHKKKVLKLWWLGSCKMVKIELIKVWHRHLIIILSTELLIYELIISDHRNFNVLAVVHLVRKIHLNISKVWNE